MAAAHRAFVRRGTVLVDEDQLSQHLYFPAGALLASWKRYEGRRAACTEITGRRWVAGYSGAMHWPTSEARLEVACSGEMWRLPFDAFLVRAQAADHPLRVALARMSIAASAISAVRLYCSTEHSVRRRVANCIIGIAEELGSSEIPATHELIAAVLAIRRPSVSEALAEFQRVGAVSCSHGRLRIADAEALAATSCPCHRTVANIFARVMPA